LQEQNSNANLIARLWYTRPE